MPGSFRTSFAGLTLTVCALIAGCSDGGGAAERSPPEPSRPGFVFLNPLVRAGVGDFAVYAMPDEKTLRYEVMAVNPLTLVGPVSVLEEQRDTRIDKMVVHDVHDFLPNQFLYGLKDFQVLKLASDTIVVAGRSWDCVVIDVVSKQLGHVRSWYSADAPVLGLVRRIRVAPDQSEGLILLQIENWSGR